MLKKAEISKTIAILRAGGIGILPTDTIYGIVGSVEFPETVERIYFGRKRDFKKPPIILAASVSDIEKFGIVLDKQAKKILSRVWPGKVSLAVWRAWFMQCCRVFRFACWFLVSGPSSPFAFFWLVRSLVTLPSAVLESAM